jgi:hypothetical protein
LRRLSRAPEPFTACGVFIGCDNSDGELAMLARQIKSSPEHGSVDIGLCLTITSLYALVGLSMVVAFM